MATAVARNGSGGGGGGSAGSSKSSHNGPLHLGSLKASAMKSVKKIGDRIGDRMQHAVGRASTPVLESGGGGIDGVVRSVSCSSSPSTPTTPTVPLTPGGIQRTGRSSSDKCRTQKKLCFREPEVISHSTSSLHKIGTIAESSTSIASASPSLSSADSNVKGAAVIGSSGFGSVRLTSKSSVKAITKHKDEVDELENQAMRIVRTVGQAFEVCHKLVGTAGEEDESEEVHESETNLSSQLDSKGTGASGGSGGTNKQDQLILASQQQSQLVEALTATNVNSNNNNNTGSSTSLLGGGDLKGASSSTSNTSTPPAQILASALTPLHHNQGSSECVLGENATNNNSKANKPRNLDLNKRDISVNDLMNLTTPSSSAVPTPTQSHSFFKEIGNQQSGKGKDKENLAQVHEAKLLMEQLEQQTQNTRAALAQIQLLRDQLAAESAARIEAQARTHQLLIHNKELLDHLQTLVRHIQELEGGASGKDRNPGSNNSMAAATGVTLPQVYNTSPHHHHHHHHHHGGNPGSNPSPNNTPPPCSTLPISFQEIEALRRQNAALLETLIYENNARANPPLPPYYPPTLAHHRSYATAHSPYPPYPTYPPQLPPPNLLYSSPYANASASLIMANSNSNQSQSSSTSSSRGLLCGDPTTSSSEMLATIFTSSGQPVLTGKEFIPGSPFIKPLETQVDGNHKQQQVLQHHLLLPPTPSLGGSPFTPKLGQIGRNASADYDAAGSSGGQGGFDDGNLRRNVLGRSVSEKIGHRSELMSQVQRTAWARHTTK